MLDNSEDSIKVIVVGDGNVGKTCMLRRFVRGDFLEQYKKTLGAEFMEKDVFLRSSNSTVKLMLWDTAGQEVFSSLTQAYYRGAGAAVLAFSTVDRDSFVHIGQWKSKVESVCGPITMVLCQTKVDLSHEASTSNEEAEALAKEMNIPLFRVSSKDDFNVTQLFEFTAQQCVEAARGAGSSHDDGGEATQGGVHHGKDATQANEPGYDGGDKKEKADGKQTNPSPLLSTETKKDVAVNGKAKSEGTSHHKNNASASNSGGNKVNLNEPQKEKKKKKMKCSLT